jgi:hypothetical protein
LFSKSPKNTKLEILNSCEPSIFFFRRDFALNLSNKEKLDKTIDREEDFCRKIYSAKMELAYTG